MNAEKVNWLLQAAVGRIRVKNAFGPMLGLSIPAMTIFAYFGHSETGFIKYALYGLAAACFFSAFGVYIFWALRRPDMLQSEDYQLRHESLEIMRSKSGPIVVDTKSLERIATSPAEKRERGRIE